MLDSVNINPVSHQLNELLLGLTLKWGEDVLNFVVMFLRNSCNQESTIFQDDAEVIS
jgi:hypothetical protein